MLSLGSKCVKGFALILSKCNDIFLHIKASQFDHEENITHFIRHCKVDMTLVPLVIRAPGRLPSGLSSPVLTGLVDLTPTLLDLIGVNTPGTMDGKSVVGAVCGKESPAESVLMGVPVPVDGITKEGVDLGWRGVRTERYTYAKWEDGSGWVLYDNEKDPYQLSNLIEQPGAARLKAEMESELKRQLDKNEDEFLPWQEYLKKSGVVYEWNLRERICYIDGGRQVDV